MLINFRNALMTMNGTNVPTITATANLTNGLQVKTWIEGVCSQMGLTNVYFTLVSAADLVENANQAFAISVNNGNAMNIVRQRTSSGSFNVITQTQLTSAYDVIVHVGDVFAIVEVPTA